MQKHSHANVCCCNLLNKLYSYITTKKSTSSNTNQYIPMMEINHTSESYDTNNIVLNDSNGDLLTSQFIEENKSESDLKHIYRWLNIENIDTAIQEKKSPYDYCDMSNCNQSQFNLETKI